MANLRNKRKLAAVSRETPESTRKSRAQNTLDPELAQDYISQVSEEIEGRTTKKLSKDFSRTESRILGALSKLDEILRNPQLRTSSVAVPGTSRDSNSENRETTGERTSEDPCPELIFSSHHSGHLNSQRWKSILTVTTVSKLEKRDIDPSPGFNPSIVLLALMGSETFRYGCFVVVTSFYPKIAPLLGWDKFQMCSDFVGSLQGKILK